MSKKSRSLYSFGNYFMVRCPLLPLSSYNALGGQPECVKAISEGASKEVKLKKFQNDYEATRKQLRDIVIRPEMEEALAISSKSMGNAIEYWLANAHSTRGAAAERGLLKYVTRASTRATPFGVLAGVAYGKIEQQETEISLGLSTDHRRHVRGDVRAVMSIARLLAVDHDYIKEHNYCVNSTIYSSGDGHKYYECNGGVAFSSGLSLISVRKTIVLDKLLAAARCFTSWSKLVETLQSCDESIEVEEAEDFLRELIQTQLLIPDIYPSPTGEEMAQSLLKMIRVRMPGHPLEAAVVALTDASDELASIPLGRAPGVLLKREKLFEEKVSAFKQELEGRGVTLMEENSSEESSDEDESVEEELVDLEDDGGDNTSKDSAKANKIYQVDMALHTKTACINHSSMKPLLKAVDSLYRISSHSSYSMLREFSEVFVRRYGTRWVKITDVLDPDCGIRFGALGMRQLQPSPLLRLPFGQAVSAPSIPSGNMDQWLVRLLVDAAKHDQNEISLTGDQIEEEFPIVGVKPPSLAMHAFVRLEETPTNTNIDKNSRNAEYTGGVENIGAKNPQWHLVRCAGPHTLTVTGRFAHVLGEEMTSSLREDAAREQRLRPELLAEVNYLPPSELANICQHPKFREYSINYLSPMQPDLSKNIELDDLLVSVEGPYVKLKSRSLGVEILPRVDHALNTAHQSGTILINFLSLVQYQNVVPGLEWNWGNMSNLPELPRVVIDGVVVAPRKWNLSKDQIELLTRGIGKGSYQKNGLVSFERVQQWRNEYCVPRNIAVGSTSDFLAIDLDSPMSVDLFLRAIKTRSEIVENTVPVTGSGVLGQGGAYANEIVIPMWLREAKEHGRDIDANSIRTVSDLQIGNNKSSYPVFRSTSDRVSYLKVYGGESYLDKLLTGDLRKQISFVFSQEDIDSWFFIRYSDPDPHLRIRFFGCPKTLQTKIVPRLEAMFKSMLGSGIHTLSTELYEPEYHRYGGPIGMDISERIFCADSNMVLDLLASTTLGNLVEGENEFFGGGNRWRVVVASCDSILSVWGLDTDQKLEFVKTYSEYFATESNLTTAHFKAIGKFFRLQKDGLISILTRVRDQEPQNVLVEVFDKHLPIISRILKELTIAENNGVLTRPRAEILSSYIHMHCNRMFITQQRRQEAILMHLMTKAYTTMKYRK